MQNKIFERVVTSTDMMGEGKEIYISLMSDANSPLSSVRPESIIITEGFSLASPIITITFNDGDGIYFNVEKIDTEEIFYLGIGDSTTDQLVIPLKISKISLKTTVQGRSDQIAYKMTFVHQGWNDLINLRRSRAWLETKYSSIVEEIAEECGYTEIEVAPTRDTLTAVIQPHWSNLTFLKWMQERSIPENYDDHFEFGCDITGKFFYKSVSNMIEEQQAQAENQEIRAFKLQSETSNVDGVSEDDSLYTYFTDFKSNEFYTNSIINGAGGTNSMYYDWVLDSFMSEENLLSENNSFTLSDFTAVNEAHEFSLKPVRNGRNSNAVNMGKTEVTNASLSMSQFNITIEGDYKINIGQMVEVLIEPDSEILKTPMAVLYSGFYIVAGVTHLIVLGEDNRYITQLDLARQGYDDKMLEGYVTTSLGKFVGHDYTGRDNDDNR